MEQAALVWGVLIPGLIVGVGTLLIPLPRTEDRHSSWRALLLAAGFGAGFVGLFGAPPMPSSTRTLAATDWMFWVVTLGGAALYFSDKNRTLALVSRLLLGSAMLAFVLRATIEYQWQGGEAVVWTAGLAGLGLAIGFSLNRLAACRDGASSHATLLVLLTGLALCAALTGSAKIGQLVGLICAGVGALWVVKLLRPSLYLSGGELTLIVVAGFGFGLCSYLYSDLPGPDACLIASAGFAPWLAELPVFRGRSARFRGGLRVVFALLLVGAAVARAAFAFETDPYDEYGC